MREPLRPIYKHPQLHILTLHKINKLTCPSPLLHLSLSLGMCGNFLLSITLLTPLHTLPLLPILLTFTFTPILILMPFLPFLIFAFFTWNRDFVTIFIYFKFLRFTRWFTFFAVTWRFLPIAITATIIGIIGGYWSGWFFGVATVWFILTSVLIVYVV